ncbi:MAG: phosphonate C-P lyase system protein PhnH [Puia sp.]|nr:phosphonate C-P lyase system protein PhnH [Puia sp.]
MSREIFYDEVFDAQVHYRILLDSMARPGKINSLTLENIQPPAGINRASVLIGMALLNADVSFDAAGPYADEITRYLILNTSAVSEEHRKADFIFIPGDSEARYILEARTGTLSYPEESATFITDVKEISEEKIPASIALTLKGPGIAGEKTVFVSGLEEPLLEALKEQNLEFPLGIDMILTDGNDHIVCIPRSNRFSYAARTA